MATLDRLITELRAGGDFDSEGAFTLDRDKAREKMRHFQLADPRAYVVELVQAAVAAGASRIAVELDADDMRMRFDGRCFDGDDFEHLYGAMFSRDDAGVLAARRQLAVGLNAAMGLDPRYARVQSGAFAMELRPGRPDQITALDPPCAGTEIHVRDRLRGQTLVRFVRQIGGDLAEAEHLCQRCRHVRAELTLNGKPIAQKPLLPDARVRGELAEPGLRATVGFQVTSSPSSAILDVLKHGVLITRAHSLGFPPDFAAAFEADSVRKDISQTAVVRDASWAQALRRLKRALWPALRDLARIGRTEPLAAAAFRRAVFDRSTAVELRRLVTGLRKGQQPDPVLAEIAAVPLWRNAVKPPLPAVPSVSLRDVIDDFCTRAASDFSSRAMTEPVPWPERQPVPVIEDEQERAQLARVLGQPPRDVADELEVAIARVKNIARWRARAMPPVLLPVARMIAIDLATDLVRGQIGLQLGFDSEATFWLIKDGCLLERRPGDGLLPSFVVALEADFTPSRLHDHVANDAVLLRVVMQVAEAVPDLLSALARTERFNLRPEQRESALRKLALPFLALDFAGEGLTRWLAMWRLQGPHAEWLAREVLAAAPLPRAPALDALLTEDAPDYARTPLLFTISGRRISLSGVAHEIAEHGTAAYVRRKVAGSQMATTRSVLILDDQELAVLHQVFGAERLSDVGGEFRNAEGHLRHLRQRKVAVELEERGVIDHRFVHDGITGHLCLLAPEPPAVGVFGHIVLLKDERLLDEVRVAMPIGAIVAIVNDDALDPNDDWTAVRDDERFRHVLEVIVTQAAGVLAQLCHRARAGAGEHRELVLNAAARVYAGRHQGAGWAAQLVEALDVAPLFYGAAGEAVKLPWIIAEAKQTGSILYVREPRALRAGVPRIILELDDREQQALQIVLASVCGAALVPAESWLPEYERASAVRLAPPRPQIALERGEALVSVRLDGARVRGEIGLRRNPREPNLELRVCQGRRVHGTCRFPSALSMVAILDDDDLPLSDIGLADLESPRLRELATLALSHVPALVAALLEHTDAPAAERAAAASHLVAFVAAEAHATDAPNAAAREMYERARRQPLFPGVGGHYSIEELQAVYARYGEQVYLPTALPGRALDRQRIVLIAGAAESVLLRKLFPVVRAYTIDWVQEQEAAALLANARPLPARPADALQARSGLIRGGLRADLWLPAEADAELHCAFGAYERTIAAHAISTLFPCAGRVEGEGGALLFGRALELSEAQRESLERLAFRLYEQLAKDLYRPSHGRALHGPRAEAARRLLQQAAHAYAALQDPDAVRAEYRAFFAALGGAPLAPRPAAATAPAPDLDREAELVQQVRAALRWAADRHVELLAASNLDRFAVDALSADVVAACGLQGVTLNRNHVLVRAVLAAQTADAALIAWIASCAYTAMNEFWVEIEDDHERELQVVLVDELLCALGSSPPAAASGVPPDGRV